MFRRKFLSIVLLAGMLSSQAVPRALAATYCDQAQFVSDLTAPDGSSFAPGAAFTKTWRLTNIGTCGWTTAYNLVWVGGDSVGAPLSVKLPVDVAPGQMVDVSVNLTAPTAGGHYKSLFKISNASGTQFGIGASASDPFWVDFNVVEVNAVIYDFLANAPYAQWKSGAGILPFPGTSGDSRGFAYQTNNPHLEDDSFDASPGLFVVPQNKFNGYIQATYPEFQIQQGDHLQTLVNCEFGATSCYVTFRIDYLLSNGVQKTLWSWKEAYDKRFYRSNIDLSSLAGQKVRFVFMLLSSGFASGDRAIWGSPRIVRAGTTQPPAPPPTLTPLPPLPATATPLGQPPPTIQPTGCDKAAFVADVTVPDGTIFSPGAAFTKTWRLKNVGSCNWTTAYKLVYYSGEQMSAPTMVNLPWGAGFDQTVDISVNMVAPSIAGKYRGYWILANATGQFFGIGTDASKPVWVEINVSGEAPINTGYDFTSNVCSAEWKSGAGILPCPGTDGNTNGFVIKLDSPKLEDGSTGMPGLLTFPQNRFNGYIQGFYPTFTVQPGDKFQTTAGCEYGAAGCYITFRLDYMTASGFIGTFWQWREQNEGKYYAANVDLTPLAGRSVRFILTTLATGSATNDRALWGSPRIVRGGGAPPTTPAPPTANWPAYINSTYGFNFKYPPGSERFFETTNSILIKMPITPGTNLMEKYLQMSVNENVNPCQSPLSDTSRPGSPTETVVFNGIPFFKQIGGDAGAGNLHEWVGYSTLKNNACISMDFVLHSLAAGAFDPPVPEFDKVAESAVFTQVMSTFAWNTPPTPTATPTPTSTLAPPTVAPPPVVASPLIDKLVMIDASNGWAIGNSYVLRTMDGGATWYNVTPPGAAGSIRSNFFPNINTGWVLISVSPPGPPGPGSLYRTTDGGLNWVHYDVPFNSGYLQFLDNTHGFVMTILGAAMNKQAVALYQTSDGGATWVRKYINDPTVSGYGNSLPLGGHKNGMTFRDITTGWVGGDTPADGFVYLYKTTNSGVTWSQQPLALPAGYESAETITTAPTFFGLNDAILPVRMITSTGTVLFIYVSHNGGTTWTRSSDSLHQGSHLDFISANNGFAWDPTGLFHFTSNAGGSWSNITPNVNFGDSIRDMDFVSTTTGWVLDTDTNGNSALYRTTDGGRTWTLLFGNPPAPSTSTPAPDPAAFAQSIVDALNARNFDSAKAKMGQTFATGYWGSEGTSSTPDQAIEAFRTSYLGTTPLMSNAAADLTALLGGLDPYRIMGLDPAKSYALFVSGFSGWGADGKSEAILYVTRQADGSLYWYGMLLAPVGFIHETPTPPALIGPFAVIGIAANDVLNIRAGAGTNFQIVGSFPANTTNVMKTGQTAAAEGAEWVEVQRPDGGLGWVNSYYLTEYVSTSSFCADARIPQLIEQLKQSMIQSNGDQFALLIGSKHGAAINFWRDVPPINYTTATARSIFTDTTVYNWGAGPVAGPGVSGTFAQIAQPDMVDVFNSSYQLGCDNPSYADMFVNPWPHTNIHYYSILKPPSNNVFDWKVWLIGFEYVNGQPYLYGTVHYVWEP
jgi:photosystem II stability/assembly factor-like uncharacterized protein